MQTNYLYRSIYPQHFAFSSCIKIPPSRLDQSLYASQRFKYGGVETLDNLLRPHTLRTLFLGIF